MLIPIRCFTCGNILADKYNFYVKKVAEYTQEAIEEGQSVHSLLDTQYIEHQDSLPVTPEYRALKDLELERVCCRRHMLTTIEIINEI